MFALHRFSWNTSIVQYFFLSLAVTFEIEFVTWVCRSPNGSRITVRAKLE